MDEESEWEDSEEWEDRRWRSHHFPQYREKSKKRLKTFRKIKKLIWEAEDEDEDPETIHATLDKIKTILS